MTRVKSDDNCIVLFPLHIIIIIISYLPFLIFSLKYFLFSLKKKKNLSFYSIIFSTQWIFLFFCMEGFRGIESRTSSEASAPELTLQSSPELAHHEQNPTLDSMMTESTSTEWTDEKHSLYLKSMEASFVNQLYDSMSFLGCNSKEKSPGSKSSRKTRCISSGQTLCKLHCEELGDKIPIGTTSLDMLRGLPAPGGRLEKSWKRQNLRKDKCGLLRGWSAPGGRLEKSWNFCLLRAGGPLNMSGIVPHGVLSPNSAHRKLSVDDTSKTFSERDGNPSTIMMGDCLYSLYAILFYCLFRSLLQFKVLRGGSWKKINFERPVVQLNKRYCSHSFVASPWIQHFRSGSKSRVLASCSLQDNASSKEVSDQNFVDEEQGEKARKGCSSPKKLKTRVTDASCNDQ
ncbi:hypothetical protein Gotur_017683, partial [Gossypium turneri]